MKLKTYTAETMAQALAHVRKDLGKDAMILHTRSYRVGAWFGIGGKTLVEITASSPNVTNRSGARRAEPRVAAQTIESKPFDPGQIQRPSELVIQRGRTVTRQQLAHAAPNGSSSRDAGPTGHDRAPRTDSDSRGLSGRDALFADEPAPAKRTAPPQNQNQPQPQNQNQNQAQPQTQTRLQEQAQRPQSSQRFADHPLAAVMIPKSPSQPPSAPRPRPAPDGASGSGRQAPENDELRSQMDSIQKMMGQVLESTRKTAVAVGNNTGQASLPSGEMPAPLFSLYARMMDNDVPVDVADALVGAVRDRLDSVELKDAMIVRQALLREIESTIRTQSQSLLTLDPRPSTARPRVIALVGPTGVGKTTTVAKLAATYKLRHNKQVGLITSDTYRIAAVEQLRTYAGIIGLPLKVANSPDELRDAIEELGECDIVVIDTAGRSQNDARRLEELAGFTTAAAPDETHLVLSTTVGENVLRKTAERFKALAPDRCILTKLDEAVTTGPIAGLSHRIGLPLSFITVGQEVPDDLEPARADRLARCVLDGPDAVLRRWSEENG